MPSTSVLVPSLGRPSSLEECLRALGRQTVAPGEVIVVWQGDDTTTRDTAERMAGELTCPVRVVHQPEAGIVPAENRALEAASGELILLTDDDAVVPPDWVERHASYYADPTIGAVGGLVVNHYEGRTLPINARTPVGRITWYGRVHGNMHDQPLAWRSRPAWDVDHLIGGNMSLRRSAFDRFKTGLRRYWQMFEAEVCCRFARAGYRVLFDPGLSADHFIASRSSVYARAAAETWNSR